MKSDTEMASNIEWRAWGRIDPLWGVASMEGKRRSEASPWTDREFYELGASDWSDYVRQWEQYGLDRNSCVEIGCGAGRLTRQLAACFSVVHGVDVSDDMISYAQRQVGSQNVHFHVTGGTSLPLSDRSVTAAFSALVFRHFDRVEDGARYFAEIARVLRPGGTMMVELPIHVWPSGTRLVISAHAAEKRLGSLRAAYRRFWLARGRGQPFFRRRTYEIGWLVASLTSLGLIDIEVRQIELRANGDRQWCVLARKA